VIENAFTYEEVATMKNEADDILGFLLNSSIANNRLSQRVDLRSAPDGQQTVRKVQPINDISHLFTKISGMDRILDPLRLLMSDEPELMEEKMSYKQRLNRQLKHFKANKADDRFLIHNDWAYYRENGYPPTIITAAVCIDDCPIESGPLHIWPGTHLVNLPHDEVQIVRKSYQIPDEHLHLYQGIDLIVPAGSLVFFHGLLAHYSSYNLTQLPRRIIFFSYVPKKDSIGLDVRNAPMRKQEAHFEKIYLDASLSGRYIDQIKITDTPVP